MGTTLSEWLQKYPEGPYEVGFWTVMPDEDPADMTAGRIIVIADIGYETDGIVFFYQGDPPTAEIVLIEEAIFDGGEEEDGWVGKYANFEVKPEGFYPYMVITVRRKEGE